MLYQIGDKVRIRQDLVADDYYYDENEDRRDVVNEEMMEYTGMYAIILSYSSTGGYRVNIDDGRWNWMDDMFVGKLANQKIDVTKSPFQSWENSIAK